MDATIFAVLAGALLAVSVGLAKLCTWIYDRRQAAAVRALTQATILSQAHAQVRRG